MANQRLTLEVVQSMGAGHNNVKLLHGDIVTD